MAEIPRWQHILNASIEHVEMDYLRAIAEGPGWPVVTIYDLTDPDAVEQARQVEPADRIEDVLVDAEVRGVEPYLVHLRVLVDPYDVGEYWWKGCPPDRFPIAIVAEGLVSVVGRSVPAGIDEALRSRMLVEVRPAAVSALRDSEAKGIVGPVVIVADLSDPAGRGRRGPPSARTSSASVSTRRPPRAGPRLSCGPARRPRPFNPDARRGPLPPGEYAVQVIAFGGVGNFTLTAPSDGVGVN